MDRDYKTFQEFWPYYLQEHAKPTTRNFHFVGTSLVIILLVYCLLTQSWLLLLALPVCGYFFAWISHAFIERNKPATFTYPLWSLVSDFKMFFLWISGRLNPHLERAGVSLTHHKAKTAGDV